MDRLMKSDVKYRFVIDIENSLKEWHLNVFSWRPIKWGVSLDCKGTTNCSSLPAKRPNWMSVNKYFGSNDNITWKLILKQHQVCAYALYIVNYCNIVKH
jgi:hypothetical protein